MGQKQGGVKEEEDKNVPPPRVVPPGPGGAKMPKMPKMLKNAQNDQKIHKMLKNASIFKRGRVRL